MTTEPIAAADDLPRDKQRVRFTLRGEEGERIGAFYASYAASPSERWAFVEPGGAAHQDGVESWRPSEGVA